MKHHCLIRHYWMGCCCARCDQVRDAGHIWEGCQCIQCGWVREQGHAWVLNGCQRKCQRCGSDGGADHAWSGCVCGRCGAINPEAAIADHAWQNCRCQRCGTMHHQWKAGFCKVCATGCDHSLTDTRWSIDDSEESLYGFGVKYCRICGLELGLVPLKGIRKHTYV